MKAWKIGAVIGAGDETMEPVSSEKQKRYKIWIGIVSLLVVPIIIALGEIFEGISGIVDFALSFIPKNEITVFIFLGLWAPFIYLLLSKIFLKIKLIDNITNAIKILILSYVELSLLLIFIVIYLFKKSSPFIR